MNIALLYLDAFAFGGYPRDVRWLAGALSETGASVQVVAKAGSHRDGIGSATFMSPDDFRSQAREFDVVHLWGMFSPAEFLLCRGLWGSGRYVITPAGQLMSAHLRRRWWKKIPYLAALQPLLARNRHVGHFFSDVEANRRARRVLHGAGHFEASLGVFPVPRGLGGGAASAGEYLLFLGRNDIHQKGIDRLVTGYSAAVRRGLRLPLLIAGQPHEGSEAVLQRLVTTLNLTRRVELLGEVGEDEKWHILRGARCLVFLSRWDGPPRPVREAIAAGTPAVVSEGTNMASLIRESSAGLSVGRTIEEVAAGLLECQDEARAASWREGATSLGQALAWERVAEQYHQGYRLAMERVA